MGLEYNLVPIPFFKMFSWTFSITTVICEPAYMLAGHLQGLLPCLFISCPPEVCAVQGCNLSMKSSLACLESLTSLQAMNE